MNIEEPTQIAKLATLFDIFIKGVISIPINLPGTRFFKAKRASGAIRKELEIIIRQRRVALEQKTTTSPQDLLSHLLLCPDENGTFMSESIVINNILMLLFAGHDTSSSTLTLVMKKLGEHPEVYEQVLQGAFREAITDIKYGGYDIPKGWKLYWNASLTHKDPSFFQDEMKFDPSRFEGTGPTPFSYVPFGGGPRMCLGKEFARLEILIFLHNVVRKFRWDLKIPAGDEKIIYDPIPTPVEGLPIRLRPHN
ncbi:hypothetical protein RD792_000104 [Penstemon davidsonii]|uniref:Cytochrome P450 n=1 Tax=Penstemon davidsonii TaxID=160366 RepID=A0ABR0DU95_9LAMI|nr:hypothetical protein RD792_000104 [Penstemon davidsonii]